MQRIKNILSIFKDPIYEELLFPSQTISCFTLEEMIAEKKCKKDGYRWTIDIILPTLQNQIEIELYLVISLPTKFELEGIYKEMVKIKSSIVNYSVKNYLK